MANTDSETVPARPDFTHLIGKESLSSWHVIDQDAVDQYAAASGDGEGEWIHLDPERAARETDYGGTIVPGFLQVANLTRLSAKRSRSSPVSSTPTTRSTTALTSCALWPRFPSAPAFVPVSR